MKRKFSTRLSQTIRRSITALLFVASPAVLAQSNLNQVIEQNAEAFSYQDGKFSGKGWNTVLEAVKSHQATLIGEDHFYNEIPAFTSALAAKIKFDSYFCEIDPYSAEAIAYHLQEDSDDALQHYLDSYGSTFSFYALAPEFALLQQLSKDGTQLYGTDQIVLTADRLMAAQLSEITSHDKANAIYQDIMEQSSLHFSRFTKGEGAPYFFTPQFESQLAELQGLLLSQREHKIISDLMLSRTIYLTQDHHLRIQLMKHNVMGQLLAILQGKSLFKYGAIHTSKAESVLGGYDIGNLVANIMDSEFKSSLHIMIIGMSGSQGVPFDGMPIGAVDPTSKDLKHYQPFFEQVNDENWVLFDLNPIRAAMAKGKIEIDNDVLRKTINGHDYLIVIPEVTAAPFINTKE